jgi:hypothetical protein
MGLNEIYWGESCDEVPHRYVCWVITPLAIYIYITYIYKKLNI